MNALQERARGALLGLAIGDAIGWPAMFHRSRVLPPWTRRLRREIDAQREEAGVLRVPMPFSLNQPAAMLEPGPTDDAEWAAWTIRRLMKSSCAIDADHVAEDWKALATEEPVIRGGVSTQSALQNLRRGLLPPASGRDNPHYFDDGAACRAVPIGIAYAGQPGSAAAAAAIDASVTNCEDGVWIASALAAGVSAACTGAAAASVVRIAIETLPPGSWSRRTVETALALVPGSTSPLSVSLRLDGIINKEYSDGCVGPESLALALALVQIYDGRIDDAVPAAALWAKNADAVPAITGALTGALSPRSATFTEWNHWILPGVALPSLGGVDYERVVNEFVAACPSLHPENTAS